MAVTEGLVADVAATTYNIIIKKPYYIRFLFILIITNLINIITSNTYNSLL